MMQRGDILIAVDENPVTGLSHSDVILFMSNAARNGVVKLTLRRENDITRTNSNSTCKFLNYLYRMILIFFILIEFYFNNYLSQIL